MKLTRSGLLVLACAVGAACSGSSSSGGGTSVRTPGPVSTARPGVSAPVLPPTATPSPAVVQPAAGPTGETQEARVTNVSDGDTIRVSIRGEEYRVRYIGIDAPELDRQGQPAEDFARESLAANRQLVKDQTVTLEKDVSETDEFGRLLRYVWLQTADGWLMVNEELVRQGFAHAGTYPPDVKYQDTLIAAEREARDAGSGLWAEEPSGIVPIAPPIANPTPKPKPQQPPARDCDPSYPDVCIPPSPPDLDCGDVSFRRFTVRAPDPHRFDGDADGIGCES